ncbi:MAG: hypothetical protein NXI30_02160 [bacterium]|nr:hypothetical protein [bacterium]
MPNDKDDLEAVRVLVDTLEPFDDDERARIIRWASEKLGTSLPSVPAPPAAGAAPQVTPAATPQLAAPQGSDIKTFVESKSPRADTQFAATVAYYYQFEAPSAERAESIGTDLLQDACRKAGRARLNSPKDTLNNTLKAGYLDKAGERGQFKINSVGENLVAMVLPDGSASAAPRKPKKKGARKKAAKKKAAKKKKGAKKAAARGRR